MIYRPSDVVFKPHEIVKTKNRPYYTDMIKGYDPRTWYYEVDRVIGDIVWCWRIERDKGESSDED